MEGIQLSVEKPTARNDISVIKVGGYIDTTTSAELEHSLDALLKAGSYNIIIDLGNVDYISSAGWGIFISEIKGIREKSGDLKLVNMIPDVYEVFELLEFHYILKAFNSIDDAIADFDQGPSQKDVAQPTTKIVDNEPDAESVEAQPSTQMTGDGLEQADIEEKIKKIVYENPEAGTAKILKDLNSPRYGNVKLGWFQIRKHLKQLNLDSKKKRIDYFRDASFG